jgi:hypothetical protein
MQMKETICLTGLLLVMNHGCVTTNPNQSMIQQNPVLLQPESLRLRHQLGTLAKLTVFWDSHVVLLAHVQKHGENVNSASYCEVLLQLRDAFCRKHPAQLAKRGTASS